MADDASAVVADGRVEDDERVKIRQLGRGAGVPLL